MVDDGDRREIRDEFATAVNMTPKELEEWLETDESKSVATVMTASRPATPRGAGSSESVARTSTR